MTLSLYISTVLLQIIEDQTQWDRSQQERHLHQFLIPSKGGLDGWICRWLSQLCQSTEDTDGAVLSESLSWRFHHAMGSKLATARLKFQFHLVAYLFMKGFSELLLPSSNTKYMKCHEINPDCGLTDYGKIQESRLLWLLLYCTLWVPQQTLNFQQNHHHSIPIIPVILVSFFIFCSAP